jgi:hypothetical protein
MEHAHTNREIAYAIIDRARTTGKEMTPEENLFVNYQLAQTDLTTDQAELRALNERIDVLVTQRQLLRSDVLADDRNDRLATIETDLAWLLDRALILDALISIARAGEAR